MHPEELEELVREGQRTSLWTADSPDQDVAFGQEDIKRIIPHRDPFLFVDEILGVNLTRNCIRGRRRIGMDDPVFRGHVPQEPIYPGVLHIETMGQLALCLIYFRTVGSARVSDEIQLEKLLALRIHHAVILAPVLPGDLLEIQARMVKDDGFTVICTGQILKNGRICSFAAIELIYVDR